MKTPSSFLPTDGWEEFVKDLFPQGSRLQVNYLEITAEEITFMVISTQPQGLCPLCGEATSRVHSRYERTLQDLPCSGVRVRLRLQVRRFFCAKPTCSRQIFSERVPALTEAFARRTNRLRDAFLEVGWADGEERLELVCVASRRCPCVLRRC